jgi:hypothetical protein
MLSKEEAIDLVAELTALLKKYKTATHFIIIPFDNGEEGTLSGINCVAAENPMLSSLLASSYAKSQILLLMQVNGLPLSAAVGAFQAIVLEAEDQLLEDLSQRRESGSSQSVGFD